MIEQALLLVSFSFVQFCLHFLSCQHTAILTRTSFSRKFAQRHVLKIQLLIHLEFGDGDGSLWRRTTKHYCVQQVYKDCTFGCVNSDKRYDSSLHTGGCCFSMKGTYGRGIRSDGSQSSTVSCKLESSVFCFAS